MNKKQYYCIILTLLGILLVSSMNIYTLLKSSWLQENTIFQTHIYEKQLNQMKGSLTQDNQIYNNKISNFYTEKETANCKPQKWIDTEEVKNMTPEEFEKAIQKWKELGVDYNNITEMCLIHID